MKPSKQYSRVEDMSPDGKLILHMQNDGDIIVAIYGHGVTGGPRFSQVEFCSPGSGGGRSMHTREALSKLAEAIEKDNEEWPIEE